MQDQASTRKRRHHVYSKSRKDACERCGSQRFLVVHHRDDDCTNDAPDNLETLCKSCHQGHHFRTRYRARNTSGYLGVGWHKAASKWIARAKHNGRQHYLGLYESPEDAAHAYDDFAAEHFGDYAVLNFPREAH